MGSLKVNRERVDNGIRAVLRTSSSALLLPNAPTTDPNDSQSYVSPVCYSKLVIEIARREPDNALIIKARHCPNAKWVEEDVKQVRVRMDTNGNMGYSIEQGKADDLMTIQPTRAELVFSFPDGKLWLGNTDGRAAIQLKPYNFDNGPKLNPVLLNERMGTGGFENFNIRDVSPIELNWLRLKKTLSIRGCNVEELVPTEMAKVVPTV